MEYKTLEIQDTGMLAADVPHIEGEEQDSPIPASSSYEYIEGSENSPYIMTLSAY